jgi:hypothetical protein
MVNELAHLLSFFVGRVNMNSRSNRPGRRSAGSIASILLVAPITTTWPAYVVRGSELSPWLGS